MKPATIVTALRMLLAPLFYGIFTTAVRGGTTAPGAAIILWLIFAVMEITDVLDGAVARKTGTTSDFGKLFDPFADSLARLTYFLAYTVSGLMPGWIFLLVLYRDLGVSFLRILAMGKGTAMGAQLSGKIKAWIYAIAGGAGLASVTVRSFFPGIPGDAVEMALGIVFLAAGATAVWTMVDYGLAFRRLTREAEK